MTSKKRVKPVVADSSDDEPSPSRRRPSSPPPDDASNDGGGSAGGGGAGASAIASASPTKPTFGAITKSTDYKTKAPQTEMGITYDLGALATNDHLVKTVAIIKFGFKSYTLFTDLDTAARDALHRVAYDICDTTQVKRKMGIEDQDFADSFSQYTATGSFQINVDTRHCAIFDRDKEPVAKEDVQSVFTMGSHCAVALLPSRVICGKEIVHVHWSAIQLKQADQPAEVEPVAVTCLLDL